MIREWMEYGFWFEPSRAFLYISSSEPTLSVGDDGANDQMQLTDGSSVDQNRGVGRVDLTLV